MIKILGVIKNQIDVLNGVFMCGNKMYCMEQNRGIDLNIMTYYWIMVHIKSY